MCIKLRHTYERVAMETFLVAHLIHHVIGCMVWCIKRTQQALYYRNNHYHQITKYASCCGFSFVNKRHTTKSTKIYICTSKISKHKHKHMFNIHTDLATSHVDNIYILIVLQCFTDNRDWSTVAAGSSPTLLQG